MGITVPQTLIFRILIAGVSRQTCERSAPACFSKRGIHNQARHSNRPYVLRKRRRRRQNIFYVVHTAHCEEYAIAHPPTLNLPTPPFIPIAMLAFSAYHYTRATPHLGASSPPPLKRKESDRAGTQAPIYHASTSKPSSENSVATTVLRENWRPASALMAFCAESVSAYLM